VTGAADEQVWPTPRNPHPAERAEIIRFWRTVEISSAPVAKFSRERLVFAVKPGKPLSWEAGHELVQQHLRPTPVWRHVVYVGVYRLDAVFEVLRRCSRRTGRVRRASGW
jgi:hypothetical protein